MHNEKERALNKIVGNEKEKSSPIRKEKRTNYLKPPTYLVPPELFRTPPTLVPLDYLGPPGHIYIRYIN